MKSIWLNRTWQDRANVAFRKRLDDLGCLDDEPPCQETSPARSAAFVENFTNDTRRMASEVIQPAGAYMDEDDDYGYETAGPDKQEDHDKSNPQDNADSQDFRNRLEKLERISRTQEERYETAAETMAVPVRTFADAARVTPMPRKRSNTHANENVKTERTATGSSKDDKRTRKSPRGQSEDNRRNNDDQRPRRQPRERPAPNNDDGGDGSDDDPRRDKMNAEKDVKREARKPLKGRPGGDEGGGGAGRGPPFDDDDDDDDGRTPRRNRARPRPVYEPGDSVAFCSDEARRQLELSMFKLPMLPRSAAELDDFQFAVKNIIMVVSGRRNRRLKWTIATTLAKDPSELDRVSRKLMSLDIKLSVACLAACPTHSHLNDILRQAGLDSNK
jgi:hypothetical protein